VSRGGARARWVAALAGAAAGAAVVEQVVAGRPRRRAKAAAPLPPPPAAESHLPTDDGGTLRVLRAGSGRPLVLVHGLLLSSDIWRFQLEGLAGEFDIVAYDQRGHGGSSSGTDLPGLPRLARDLADLLEALDLRDAVLVGHSMGGMAALRMAADAPEVLARRVGALMLVSTSAGPLTPLPPAAWRRLVASAEPGMRRTLEFAAARRFPLARDDDLGYLGTRISFGADPNPALVELTRLTVSSTRPTVMADVWDSMLNIDLRHACPTVGVPTMVVVGGRDVLTPPRMARAMARRLPEAELVVLPGCGHMPMLERPEELAGLIRSLAARSGGGAPGRPAPPATTTRRAAP